MNILWSFNYNPDYFYLPRSQASPVLCSSVCVQYNTRKRKSAKKRERPGLIHHVSDVRVHLGGRENDVRLT